jgi:ABC-type antimicrobial peptide transport system permease subunit
MKFSEISEAIVIAFDAIRVNKLRAFLASLGVVIGISFVILMGWLIAGLDKVLLDTINMIGSDMLYVDKMGLGWRKKLEIASGKETNNIRTSK